MSILNALNRALDKVDGAAATAIAGHRAQKEAREFAASVEPGHTYYSVVDCHFPWGKGRLLQEWTFSTRKSWATGQYMCGHLTAAGVWLGFGPIHKVRPGKLLTAKEYSNRPEFPPDAAHALGDLKVTPAGV